MGYRNLYPGGREEPDIYSRSRAGAAPEFLDFKRLLAMWLTVGGAPMWTSATACRRDALIEAGLFPAGRCFRGGDKDMWLRTAALGTTALNPKITATYYKNSVNMVTGKLSANDRHCMCQSIEAMLPRVSGAIGSLLRKVYNLRSTNTRSARSRHRGSTRRPGRASSRRRIPCSIWSSRPCRSI
jgi:hypothetical protein